jgi:hypothetical protein
MVLRIAGVAGEPEDNLAPVTVTSVTAHPGPANQASHLDLSECKLLVRVDALSKLLELRSSHLSRWKTLCDLQPPSALVGLHTLDLRGCRCLHDVRPLSSLCGFMQARSHRLQSCAIVDHCRLYVAFIH